MRRLQNDIDKLLLTVAEISATKGEANTSNLIKAAKFDVKETEYDNCNGGQYGYTLHMQLPINIYSKIEDNLQKYEEGILNKLRPITRKYENEYVSSVLISPVIIGNHEENNLKFTSTTEPESIKFWENNYYRIFISHTSRNKLIASQLQRALSYYGVTAFVAHEDIEPSKEWMGEIELALATMDGLLALVTNDFSASKWCDQEVGIAIGMKVLVLSIGYGADPYGFFGKYQAISFTDIDRVTASIVDILITNVRSKKKMANAICTMFCRSSSFAEAKYNVGLLEQIAEELSDEMKEQLRVACVDNSQIKGSWGVVDRVNWLLGSA